MAKTYVDVAKYIIHVEFEIKGVVEKHDIIGAIFGQCEGLLGEEMDLKELQDAGKLGRIEVNLESKLGVTKGEVLIPSSTDTASTSLLAAAVETVDKVGPCEAKFKTTRIEDVREDKRKILTERAKEILKQLSGQLPEAKELATELKEDARIAEIQEYGREKLPAGPDIESEKEIIVVEGRADVINLLRNHIANVIGMGGAKIAEEIIELSRRKEITLFIDGDRGGELNARKLVQVASVKYIAKAPDGKEVEELARKEILAALRNKKPANEVYSEPKQFAQSPEGTYRHSERPRSEFSERREFSRDRPRFSRGPGRFSSGGGRDFSERRFPPRGRDFGYPRREGMGFPAEERPAIASIDEKAKFEPLLQSLKGSLQAKLYNEDMKEIASMDVKGLVEGLASSGNVHAIVFDGIITKRLLDESAKHSCKYIVGIRKGKIAGTSGIKLLTF
ncbi:MAG: DNA primase [Candidatus Diapherotrites archaeon]|nr:DNA primase [Candidatus Diapherotrites archaeon]